MNAQSLNMHFPKFKLANYIFKAIHVVNTQVDFSENINGLSKFIYSSNT